MSVDPTGYAALRKQVVHHDHILRGNGRRGLIAEVDTLKSRDDEVQRMLQEWRDTKAQLRGAKTAIVVVGVIIVALGGTLGASILSTLADLLAAMP